MHTIPHRRTRARRTAVALTAALSLLAVDAAVMSAASAEEPLPVEEPAPEPVIDEPVVEEPVVEEPVIEEPVVVEPPSAPLDLAVQARPTELRLSWAAPEVSADLVTDYVVELSTDGLAWTEVPGDVDVDPSQRVLGLEPGTAYVVRVTAVAGDLVGAPSDPVHATTAAAPSVPVQLRAVSVRTKSVTVTWERPLVSGAWVDDYDVEVSADGGATWTSVAGPASSARTQPLTGLTPATRYQVRVSAGSGSAWSETSAPLHVLTASAPSAPRRVKASSITSSGARLTWQAPSTSGALVTDYVISLSRDGRTWTTYPDAVSTATSATLTGLTPSTRYWVRVVGVADAGTTGATATVSVTSTTLRTTKTTTVKKPTTKKAAATTSTVKTSTVKKATVKKATVKKATVKKASVTKTKR